jgi:hypothetical protein
MAALAALCKIKGNMNAASKTAQIRRLICNNYTSSPLTVSKLCLQFPLGILKENQAAAEVSDTAKQKSTLAKEFSFPRYPDMQP